MSEKKVVKKAAEKKPAKAKRVAWKGLSDQEFKKLSALPRKERSLEQRKLLRREQLRRNNITYRKRIAAGKVKHSLLYKGKPTKAATEDKKLSLKAKARLAEAKAEGLLYKGPTVKDHILIAAPKKPAAKPAKPGKPAGKDLQPRKASAKAAITKKIIKKAADLKPPKAPAKVIKTPAAKPPLKVVKAGESVKAQLEQMQLPLPAKNADEVVA